MNSPDGLKRRRTCLSMSIAGGWTAVALEL